MPTKKLSFSERLKRINEWDGNLIFGAKKFHSSTSRLGKGKPASGELIREQRKIVRDTNKERFQRISKYWEEVKSCPVCKSKKKLLYFKRMGVDIYNCQNCRHRYMTPRPKFNKACELYSDDKSSADIWTSKNQKRVDYIKHEYSNHLIDLFTKKMDKNKILDIGCGAGYFLDVSFKNGWKKCIGVDINNRYKKGYEDINGVQFINSPIEKISEKILGDNYDCISLQGVLEHLYDLDVILKKISKLLRPNGVVYIMIPNGFSLVSAILREKSPTFMWKHLNHFSPESLTSLFHKYKFKSLHCETAVTEIDNIKSYLSGEPPYNGYGDPKNIFSFIDPSFIHKNLLGSRLISIFRKK